MIVDPNYSQMLAQAISRSGATEQTLTNELSSGLRISQLSDDPAAVAQNVGLSSSISRLDTFVQSANVSQSRMQVADDALGEVVTQATKAISLAVSAGNGTLSSADLTSLQTQVSSIRDSILALANTSYQGQYVFAGSKGNTQPFTLDSSSDPAVATYAGDNAVQQMETSDGQKLSASLSGSAVFTASGNDLLGTLNQLVSDLGKAAAGTGGTSSLQADSSALTGALGAVNSQRAALDSSLSRITSASGYASAQEAVLKAQQSTLLSADSATVATDLKTAETQQQALLAVTSALEGQQNLFAYLK